MSRFRSSVPAKDRTTLWVGFGLLALLFFAPSGAGAQPCSNEFKITHQFESGARWDLCWEVRFLEGIVLHDVRYKTPAGFEMRLFDEVAISQIHVPYDDNSSIRYHDVTDYGMGDTDTSCPPNGVTTSCHLNDLTPTDCPHGVRLDFGNKQVLCKTDREAGYAHYNGTSAPKGKSFELHSSSQLSRYSYQPMYRFHEDGSVEMAIGASGKLQRFTSDPGLVERGWVMGVDPLDAIQIGISHLHNYFWRIDLAMGASDTDDSVKMIELVEKDGRQRRERTMIHFTQEVAQSVSPDLMRRILFVDGTMNSDGKYRSLEFEPLLYGHRTRGWDNEPFTWEDFVVTVDKPCERFASHNPAVGGCGADLSQFVDGESLVGQDVVAWIALSFHHLPRDEDGYDPNDATYRMPMHWNSFILRPRDLTPQNVFAEPRFITELEHRIATIGLAAFQQMEAIDEDSSTLIWGASGLPAGLQMNPQTGTISGTPSGPAGEYTITVTVSDGTSTSSFDFVWVFGDPFGDDFESGDTSAWSAATP